MGHQGQMVGLPASKVGCAIAAGICGYLVVIGIKLLIEIATATNQIAGYEQIELEGKQPGFWKCRPYLRLRWGYGNRN
jgi:hypothetical protein